MDKNRDQDAVDVLNELLDMRGIGALKHVGRVRPARILLYQDKPQEVLDLLAGQENAAFDGLYAESMGDAHAALGDYDKAREAYNTALADTTQTVNRGFVEMKLLDLPDDVPVAEPVPEESAADAEVATEDAAGDAVEPEGTPVEEGGDTE